MLSRSLLVATCLIIGVACSATSGRPPALPPPDSSTPIVPPLADAATVPPATTPADAAPVTTPPDAAVPADAAPPVDASGGWWSGAVPGSPTLPANPASAMVVVDRAMHRGHLTPDFAGLSYEKTHLTDRFFTGDNAALIALFKLLGSSSLRIGGNAVDLSSWQPDAPPAPAGMPSAKIGSAGVDDLAAFVNATGWKVIYGLNLKTSNPTAAAAEAEYAAGKLGDQLYGFEIGNEINQFGDGYPATKAHWEMLASGVKAALPDARFVGPAVYGSIGTWAVPFARDEASLLTMVTQHYYLGAAGGATVAQLLADGKYDGECRQLQAATSANNIKDSYRFAEANSYFNHGQPGVSDTLGAALWSIDFMLASAGLGANGVNFHGGGPGQDLKHLEGFTYTPIDETGSKVTGVKAMFYGMLLVATAGSGDMLATTVKADTSVSAYAVQPGDGGLTLVLVNKDGVRGVTVAVDLGGPATSAAAIYLQGGQLSATSGFTFGGAGVTASGAWARKPAFLVPVSGSATAMATVSLPPASAALVRVQ
jgi:hypothetical protein